MAFCIFFFLVYTLWSLSLLQIFAVSHENTMKDNMSLSPERLYFHLRQTFIVSYSSKRTIVALVILSFSPIGIYQSLPWWLLTMVKYFTVHGQSVIVHPMDYSSQYRLQKILKLKWLAQKNGLSTDYTQTKTD